MSLEGAKTEIEERLEVVEIKVKALSASFDKVVLELKKVGKKLKVNIDLTDEAMLKIDSMKEKIEDLERENRNIKEKLAEMERGEAERQISNDGEGEENETPGGEERGENEEREAREGEEEREICNAFDKERVLLVRKGPRSKEVSFRKWAGRRFVAVSFRIDRIKQREDKERIYARREEAKREDCYVLDELLTFEERSERFELIKKAEEIENMYKSIKKNVEIKKENRYIEIEGKRFVWDKYENGLREIAERNEEATGQRGADSRNRELEEREKGEEERGRGEVETKGGRRRFRELRLTHVNFV